jgi:leucyl/phenylalanyl-tRNA--protein transferase
MFSKVSGGSKVALAALARILHEWGWPLFDAQVESSHLVSMGAQTMARDAFLAAVERQTSLTSDAGTWHLAVGRRDLEPLVSSLPS